jgi:hypothetical protein
MLAAVHHSKASLLICYNGGLEYNHLAAGREIISATSRGRGQTLNSILFRNTTTQRRLHTAQKERHMLCIKKLSPRLSAPSLIHMQDHPVLEHSGRSISASASTTAQHLVALSVIAR